MLCTASQRGSTLIELIVALSLASIIFASMVTLTATLWQRAEAIDQWLTTHQAIRHATSILSNDLQTIDNDRPWVTGSATTISTQRSFDSNDALGMSDCTNTSRRYTNGDTITNTYYISNARLMCRGAGRGAGLVDNISTLAAYGWYSSWQPLGSTQPQFIAFDLTADAGGEPISIRYVH